MLRSFYEHVVLKYPKIVLLSVALVAIFMAFQALGLRVDASAQTLILDDDKDLAYTRTVSDRYKSSDILVVTYAPHGYLLSSDTIEHIRSLSDKLESLDGIESVTSILNVPLLQSPPKPVDELLEKIPSIGAGDANLTLAHQELLNNPLYTHNLVSGDLKTTAIVLNLKDDDLYKNFLTQIRVLQDIESLSSKQADELEILQDEFKHHRDKMRLQSHNNIEQVRGVLSDYSADADLFLGGMDMIADDMITFVKRDLSTYGIVVLLLLIVVLWIVFGEFRWVLLPVVISVAAISITLGSIASLGWEITVISSNFIALQLILTISIVIHLIVRYRELALENSQEKSYALALHATLSMSKPTFFAVITTMAGFASLMLSGIKPVIALGWMMSIGLSISFVVAYLVFPALVLLMRSSRRSGSLYNFAFIKYAANLVEKRGVAVIVASLIISIFSIVGATKLMVENSFVSYFKPSTQIYQGMMVIDTELGGTTPLDVTIDLPLDIVDDDLVKDDEFDEFDEEFSQASLKDQYWFNDERMQMVSRAHEYLQGLDGVGKVLSLATMLEVGKSLNGGESLGSFELALLYNELPDSFASIILYPYLNIQNNQVRLAMRIVDSDKNLRRNELLEKIKHELPLELAIEPSRVHLSGAMVLYNNMLQSLFSSQISTLGAMALLLFFMFWILFGSFKVACVAIVANLVPVGVVFGFMGFMKIPLDMMTITIAAISIGIAVDNTIHYLHRFRKELRIEHDYKRAMYKSHASIGYAMTYTSVTIIIGFLVLLLSVFVPTIYFGALTVLAMIMAILADLLLLPKLLILFKPFKKIS